MKIAYPCVMDAKPEFEWRTFLLAHSLLCSVGCNPEDIKIGPKCENLWYDDDRVHWLWGMQTYMAVKVRYYDKLCIQRHSDLNFRPFFRPFLNYLSHSAGIFGIFLCFSSHCAVVATPRTYRSAAVVGWEG
ncbi:MAG: hypothetical protein HZB19_03910 [Chloroflexi bacterium]|nr:hypothetical protein [Chloroflexota bacterium]